MVTRQNSSDEIFDSDVVRVPPARNTDKAPRSSLTTERRQWGREPLPTSLTNASFLEIAPYDNRAEDSHNNIHCPGAMSSRNDQE